jgi:hypothetical protein
MSADGDSERFTIGAEVEASDARCGQLTGMIVDPVAQKLTHLIVKPRHHHGFGRLVPVGLVASDSDALRLNCTEAEFLKLDEAEQVQFDQAAAASLNYELGGLAGLGARGVGDMGLPPAAHLETTDRIPAGEVEVRRGDQVHASDGWIGSVKGLVVDPADDHVTHLLLDEGHLWGRKQVAIPIGKTARIDDEIRVEMTKEAIKNLPPVSVAN